MPSNDKSISSKLILSKVGEILCMRTYHISAQLYNGLLRKLWTHDIKTLLSINKLKRENHNLDVFGEEFFTLYLVNRSDEEKEFEAILAECKQLFLDRGGCLADWEKKIKTLHNPEVVQDNLVFVEENMVTGIYTSLLPTILSICKVEGDAKRVYTRAQQLLRVEELSVDMLPSLYSSAGFIAAIRVASDGEWTNTQNRYGNDS